MAIFAVAGFLGVVLFSNRPVTMSDGSPVITTNDQYNKISQDTQSLIAEPLLRADRGSELSQEDREKLLKGIPTFEALGDFAPTEMTPFFVLSKLYFNTEKPEQAEERARQAIYNGEAQIAKARNDKDETRVGELQALLNESHHVRAQALFGLGRYRESVAEIKGVLILFDPKDKKDLNVPRYLVTLARSLNELKDIENARAALLEALERDPKNTQAQGLLNFINGV